MNGSSVSKQRLCFKAQAHLEFCNIVKLAQEIVRGGVSLRSKLKFS